MFKEYDVIVSKRPIGDIPVGTIGAIVLINKDDVVGGSYEVEFIDEDKNFLGVFTVSNDDIELQN